MSSPQTAKGQVIGIVCKAVGGIWLWLAKSWHLTQHWTRSCASARAVAAAVLFAVCYFLKWKIRPIKPSAEGLANKGPSSSVVSAETSVNFR